MDEMKGFPVSKNALRIKAEKNNELLTSKEMSFFISTGGGNGETPVALTEHEVSQILEFIDGLSTYCHMDNKVLETIRTESERFFAGKISAEEAAETIQQKVNIYLNE
jgi:hypothetical protein